jgi:hypothetical protein
LNLFAKLHKNSELYNIGIKKQMIFLLICYIFVSLRQNSCKWKKAIVRNMAYID